MRPEGLPVRIWADNTPYIIYVNGDEGILIFVRIPPGKPSIVKPNPQVISRELIVKAYCTNGIS